MSRSITVLGKKRARVTGERRDEVARRVRAYGVRRIAEALGKHYATINQKLSGFSSLYEADIEQFERIMKS